MESTVEKADRISRRRARILPVLAIMLFIQQATFFGNNHAAGTRTVDVVHFAGWIAMTLLTLLVLVSGGGWKHSREVRELMNDDVTRVNRAKALSTGFVVAMLVTVILYAVSFFSETAVRDALHVVATSGLAAALLRFAILEKRALG